MCVGLAWVVLVLAGEVDARPQGDETQLADRKFEVGAQFSFLRESPPPIGKPTGSFLFAFTSQTTSPNSPGLGGRVGYNFSSHIAVEGEFTFFPRETGHKNYFIIRAPPSSPGSERLNSDLSLANRWKTEAVFGLKAGGRMRRIGLFGKARPGLMYSSEVWSGGSDTNFAMDLGGVFEYYSSPRTLVRLDASDLMVQFDERDSVKLRLSREKLSTHNFRLGVGFGFRF